MMVLKKYKGIRTKKATRHAPFIFNVAIGFTFLVLLA